MRNKEFKNIEKMKLIRNKKTALTETKKRAVNFLAILISLCSCIRVQLSLILCLSNQFRYRTKILI